MNPLVCCSPAFYSEEISPLVKYPGYFGIGVGSLPEAG
jgi:hypothetical protein